MLNAQISCTGPVSKPKETGRTASSDERAVCTSSAK